MWFLFVEIFFLISVSFLLGSAITTLALRMFLRGSDNDTKGTGEVTS